MPVEAMHALDRLNGARCEAGKPAAAVDSRSMSGKSSMQWGAVDRLDLHGVGPAVNEVARIETCANRSPKVWSAVRARLATAAVSTPRP